jgi:hypothetical protein
MIKAKYYIYRNLHTGGFSVKHRGLVIARGNFFIATGVTFVVSILGRDQVLFDKRKNVHAYAACDKYTFEGYNKVDMLREISYNPYKLAHFVCDNIVVTHAKQIMFSNGKCYMLEE